MNDEQKDAAKFAAHVLLAMFMCLCFVCLLLVHRVRQLEHDADEAKAQAMLLDEVGHRCSDVAKQCNDELVTCIGHQSRVIAELDQIFKLLRDGL